MFVSSTVNQPVPTREGELNKLIDACISHAGRLRKVVVVVVVVVGVGVGGVLFEL